MATKTSKIANEQKPKKLDKTHPNYYREIGRQGGLANLKKNGPSYFSDIAKLSHKPGCRPESPARDKPEDNLTLGSSKPSRRRA